LGDAKNNNNNKKGGCCNNSWKNKIIPIINF
jgi:hypothetical protein